MYRISGLIPAETFEYTEDTLECTPRELELVVLEGKKVEGSLFLRADTGRRIRAFLYSTHYRMQPQASYANGEEIHITYRFDAVGLSVGSCVRGKLVILTDIGQLQIPFCVTVSDSYEDETLGRIRNLFHFTNLASTDWKAACDLFYSERFEKLLTGHDSRLIPLYRGMSHIRGNEKNVDEFLISLNKKQRASYTIDEETLLLPQVYEPQEQVLTIRRKGWGYTHLSLSVEGSYISLDRTLLTDDDFEDQVCHLSFYLLPTDGFEHREKLLIDTHSPSGTLVCELVRIGKQQKEDVREQARREKKRKTAELIRAYLDYSTGHGDQQKALERAEKCIEKINQSDGRNIDGRLYQTHLLCAMGRFQEAGWIFSHVERVIENEEVSASQMSYYWYLESMLARGGVRDVDYQRMQSGAVRRIRDLLANHRGDAIVTSLYLRMLPQGQITPVQMISLYEECYYNGCESPILFREAFRVIGDNPTYMSSLGRFEIAVMQFAMRYELLTPALTARITELVKKEKEAGRALMGFLKRLYDTFGDDELLQAVCGLLIRCQKTDEGAGFWFGRAVDKQLRITLLYESYIASRSMEDLSLPPKYVLLYFAYQCTLEKRLKAHLYRIILENHTKLGSLIDKYDPQIRDFARKELLTGEISPDLAACYRFLFRDEKEIEAAVPYLLPLAFMQEASVTAADAKKVIVLEHGLETEKSFAIENKVAMVEMVSEDVCLLLEDENGNRHEAGQDIRLKRLLSPDKVRKYLLESEQTSSELSLLRLSGTEDDFMRRTEDWPLYMEAARDPRISFSLRRSIVERLLAVLYDRDETQTMLELLNEYPIEGADEKKRGRIITYHILLEQDEMALSLLWDYGFEGVPVKSLNRLIMRALDEQVEEDARWIALMYYTYKQGKYTPQLLEYLCQYYEGGISQMVQIFQDALALDVPALDVAERILTAAVFSHGYLPQWDAVFQYYSENGGSEDKKKRFLQDLCFKCFVGGEVLSNRNIDMLEKQLMETEDMPRLCRIVWLDEKAGGIDDFSQQQARLALRLIDEQLNDGGYLPLMEPYAQLEPRLLPFTAYSWLVYRSAPGRNVRVSFLGGAAGQESYQIRPLAELCPGYYCREFVLFSGESIHYYIQEENHRDMVLTQSGQIEAVGGRAGSLGRYDRLDAISLDLKEGKKEDAVLKETEYMRLEKLTQQLFAE